MTVSEPVSETPWLQNEDQKPLIQIKGVTKKYGEVTAVDNVDLDIYRGELFCLLGGSGCGKSTLLRMLAGFEDLNSGTITIDGVDMANVPAYERPTNMMFQSYALFPHMTVEKNVAFGLEQDNVPKLDIADRVHEILKLVELEDFKKRKPKQLSGGQRQRVALARALVKRPKLLLLDEPLAALDKKLRKQTQFELANIQEKVGVTFVVVTHDQEEAMTLSTRMAVMDAGRFKQIGTPTEIYEFPESRFVADFIGSANIFEGRVVEDGADHVRVETGICDVFIDHGHSVQVGAKIWVALRPEKIRLEKSDNPVSGQNQAAGVIDDIGYLGETSIYKVRLENGQIFDVSAPNQARPMNRTHRITWEDRVNISWDPSSAMLLNS
ncbi:ABC transporter ATP-binding protein [Primorskyibacter sp. S87]|uniref:ABC transporter ATP-binding protein n=1 Tax=Primorskyibacter sp. S87 TaxID=3415126 RepID=UPI003C7A8F1F